MKEEDYKLIVIENDGTYVAHFENPTLKGITVQCENIEDIPKEMAKSIEVLLMYGFDKGTHDIVSLT
jgi:hypothetical protein